MTSKRNWRTMVSRVALRMSSWKNWARLFRLDIFPVERLSTTVTRCPARRYASTTWDPMKPPPPVSRIFRGPDLVFMFEPPAGTALSRQATLAPLFGRRATEIILQAYDVSLAKVLASLHFDHHQWPGI